MRTASEPKNLIPKVKPSILRIPTHHFHTRPTRPPAGFAARSLRPPPLFHSPLPVPSHTVGEFVAGRCCVRGCVYPSGPTGLCLDHQRQAQEPRFFHSHQPTMLVLDQARFGVPDSELDDTRSHDRRRLAAAREVFLEEAA